MALFPGIIFKSSFLILMQKKHVDYDSATNKDRFDHVTKSLVSEDERPKWQYHPNVPKTKRKEVIQIILFVYFALFIVRKLDSRHKLFLKGFRVPNSTSRGIRRISMLRTRRASVRIC